MRAAESGVLARRPDGLSDWAIIRFFPDYAAEHPLWLADGLPDLTALHLPPEVNDRLTRWAEYWDRNHHWEAGWADQHPEPWWIEERAQLPRDLATSLGADFAIRVEGGYIHSGAPATQPAAATAMTEYVRRSTELADDAAKHPGAFRMTAGSPPC